MKLFGLIASISLILCSCSEPTVKNLNQIIQKDNLRAFERITQQIDIDTVFFFNGRNVLHSSLENHASEISKKLIEEEYQLNAIDSSGQTPLLMAIVNENDDELELLLEKQIDLDILDNLNGYTALHYAISKADVNLFKQLIEKGANYNIKSSEMNQTPLHKAIEHDNLEIVQLLLQKEALDTIRDINNNTVIDLALESDNTEVKKLFFHKMTKEDKENLFINTARSGNDTVFLKKLLEEKWITKKLINNALIFSKDTITSLVLLKKGAKIDYKHPKYDYGAIHYAAIRGDIKMLEFLINKGAKINQLSKEATLTPLMHAAQLYNEVNSLNVKVEGMQLNMNEIFYDSFGMSKEKTKENSLEAVQFLVSKKANLSYKNKSNENVLYHAKSTHNNTVAEYLKTLSVKETKKITESKSNKLRRASSNF